MLPCIAAVAIATFVGKKTFESHAHEGDHLLMENVEALAQTFEPGKEVHYSNMHFACYKTVKYGETSVLSPDGTYRASCWQNDKSNKGYHQHICNSCKSY